MFKPGDKVRVVNISRTNAYYNDIKQYIGVDLTISELSVSGYYRLVEMPERYLWSEKCLQFAPSQDEDVLFVSNELPELLGGVLQ